MDTHHLLLGATMVDTLDVGVDDYETRHTTHLEKTLSEAVNAIFEAKPEDPIAFLMQHLEKHLPSTTHSLAPPPVRTNEHLEQKTQHNAMPLRPYLRLL